MSSANLRNRAPLQPGAFVPLPLGAVKPRRWLLDQCRLQAEGFTGHLEEYWPDLGPDNMWLGGATEGWERGPYYLDGLVPLAHVLDDERLKAMAQRWLDSILGMQDESGWIGPVKAPDRHAYDQWPVAILLKVLTQHFEATEDPRVIPAMLGFCRYLRDTLAERPLFEWGRFRWADLVLSIHWLYNQTGEEWLLEVAKTAAEQGYDWRTHFAEFRYRGKTEREECKLETHVVNSAMAVKTGGVWYRQSANPKDRESVYQTLDALDSYHGQVTGVFTGDEHYAGPEPTQGTELCAVVELMYSLEELLPVLGDPLLADRLERIAFNALPAAFTPDMWAHQYDQQANQVLCTVAPRAWTLNDDTSNTFGLEPNYGCCTANLHQGWPKLVRSLWMATPDGGLAAIAYAPCEVTTTVGDGVPVTVTEHTDYPFRDCILLTIAPEREVRFPLMLRVPRWAEGATVQVGEGAPISVEPGSFYTVDAEWKPGDTVLLSFPMRVRLEPRLHGAVSLLRGPLVFSLRIGEEFRLLRGTPPRADWEVLPTTPWNYGLALERHAEDLGLRVEEAGVSDLPFDPAAPPVELKARARRVLEWGMDQNSAAPVPESPASSQEPLEEVDLIPYGSAHLRITEFPEVAG